MSELRLDGLESRDRLESGDGAEELVGPRPSELDGVPPEAVAAGGVGIGADDGGRTSPESAPPSGRGAVDPVKALMHRHRELCERAVDPLEIAAGLEAHGVTDRTAARFRHRDVFSLAEEMYARVPRDAETPPERRPMPAASGPGGGWAVLALLPGALCAAAVAGVRLTHGQPRLVVAAAGALAVALGLRVALRRGPLRSPLGTTGRRGTWTCWLLAYALLGDGLLAAGLADGPDGPDGPWPLATAPVLALALSCAPALWCAHLLSVRARRKLVASRGLADFADSVKPLLLGVFALYLCALVSLLALCGTVLDEPAVSAGAVALGALLLLARLLTVHGFPHVPAAVLCAAALTESCALATVFASRLPGCSFLAVPVRTATDAWGPGAVPALVCGVAALLLLAHAIRTLTRASAYARPPGAT
ncbi:hypothetical protein [Streptomyces sp. MA5143a]|uniref:hypothetical protein n=1 Tax=Streptomyces sp. MA5143a TaxID=2083010 RepID=UPI000D2D3D0A|nr:hypothetical protein [Streptomyces sp. MA5143a]SPF02029.1 hypothetical protein SMA5143A_2784 [Streptomyces sp. MA5143a]